MDKVKVSDVEGLLLPTEKKIDEIKKHLEFELSFRDLSLDALDKRRDQVNKEVLEIFEALRQCKEVLARDYVRKDDLKKIITDAHMAGQHNQGVDASWSEALAYFNQAILNRQQEKAKGEY